MSYEWDPVKALENHAKHGVHFADAQFVLEDDLAVTIRDPLSEDEERWIAIGSDVTGRVLVVVYAWRDNNVRLISARGATASERAQYEG